MHRNLDIEIFCVGGHAGSMTDDSMGYLRMIFPEAEVKAWDSGQRGTVASNVLNQWGGHCDAMVRPQ